MRIKGKWKKVQLWPRYGWSKSRNHKLGNLSCIEHVVD